VALCALVACKKTVDGPMALCASEVEGGEAAETQSNDVPPEIWFALILKSYNGKTKEPARPARDCTNRPLEIEDEQVSACIKREAPALPPRPLDGDKDLELIGLEEGTALVWVRTDYFEDGDALGPIAIAEYRKNGLAIRALGALRANPNRVRMRLEPMGEGTVLVVESMVCPPDDPQKCARVMRLVPREGDRFVERPLYDEKTNACLGPATFELSRFEEIKREDGIIRRFELARTFDFEEGVVTINEQVTIKDIDPTQPDAPPAIFRKAQKDRTLQLDGSGLKTIAPLWESVMAEHGSVQVKAAKPAEGEAESGEAKPGEVKSGEAKPGEAKPGEAKPGEAKPGEAKSGKAASGKAGPG
jgi:uncharacterized low-complexity protein